MTAGTVASAGRLYSPAFIAISAATLAFFTSSGVFLPTTPRFTVGPLGGDDAAVGLVLGSFAVSSIILKPFAGQLADRRGRRLVLIFGSVAMVAASFGHLVADTIPLLVVMRLLLGAAEALFFVAALAAITDIAPEHRRGEAISLISIALYLGVAVGPVIGEELQARMGFDSAWIAAGILAVVSVALSWFAPETLPREKRSVAGTPIVWLHPRGIEPGLLVLCGAWGMGAYFAFLPLLGDELGLDGVSGYLAAFAIIVVGLRVVGARLPDRLGAARLSGTALTLTATGMVIAGVAPSEVGLWAATIVFAFGVAFTFPAIVALAVQGIPAEERGAVTGTTSLFIDVAFGLSPALLGLLAGVAGYPSTFLVSAAFAAVGAAWLLLRRRGGRAGAAARLSA
jgi:MFS family permease